MPIPFKLNFNGYPIDYGNITTFDTTAIRKTVQSMTDLVHALGFKTKEEEEEEKRKIEEERRKREEERRKAESGYAMLSTPAFPGDVPATSPQAAQYYLDGDAESAKAIQAQQDAIGSAAAATSVALPYSFSTIGVLPTLVTEATSAAGAYGGYKLGEAIDEKYKTNTAPWLSFIGGAAGGGLGYKGLLKLGSKNLLPTATKWNIYGPQFRGNVVADYLDNSKFNYNEWLTNERYKLWNDLTVTKDYSPKVYDKVSTKSTWADQFKDGNIAANKERYLGSLKSSDEFLKDYPGYYEYPEMYYFLREKRVRPGSSRVYPPELLNIHDTDFGRYVETPTGAYYLGPRQRHEYTPTLVHQGKHTPIIDGRTMVPITAKNPNDPTTIWWEQNHPFYGPSDATFIIDDLIPTISAKRRTGWGNETSVLSDAVNLSRPDLNFRMVRLSPTDGLPTESPFVFPKRWSLPKVPSYKLFDETDWEAWRAFARSRYDFKQGGSLPKLKSLCNNETN